MFTEEPVTRQSAGRGQRPQHCSRHPPSNRANTPWVCRAVDWVVLLDQLLFSRLGNEGMTGGVRTGRCRTSLLHLYCVCV